MALFEFDGAASTAPLRCEERLKTTSTCLFIHTGARVCDLDIACRMSESCVCSSFTTPVRNVSVPPAGIASTALKSWKANQDTVRHFGFVYRSQWKHLRHDNAEEALRALRLAHQENDPFQIVISDYQMPFTDGGMLAAAIKGDPELKTTVFVMLSSMGHSKEIKDLVGHCVDAYLVKPVRPSKLLDTLARTWSTARNDSSIADSVRSLRESVTGRFAGHGARALVAEDNAVNQKGRNPDA